MPENVGNVTFGDSARDIHYIAVSSSLYRIGLATRGVQHPCGAIDPGSGS